MLELENVGYYYLNENLIYFSVYRTPCINIDILARTIDS